MINHLCSCAEKNTMCCRRPHLPALCQHHIWRCTPCSAAYCRILAGVEYAVPDLYIELQAVPNDPQFPQQWGLPQVGAPAAWDISTGSAAAGVASAAGPITVCVVDSGVDPTHPDLAANLHPDIGYNAYDPTQPLTDYIGARGAPSQGFSPIMSHTPLTTTPPPPSPCRARHPRVWDHRRRGKQPSGCGRGVLGRRCQGAGLRLHRAQRLGSDEQGHYLHQLLLKVGETGILACCLRTDIWHAAYAVGGWGDDSNTVVRGPNSTAVDLTAAPASLPAGWLLAAVAARGCCVVAALLARSWLLLLRMLLCAVDPDVIVSLSPPTPARAPTSSTPRGPAARRRTRPCRRPSRPPGTRACWWWRQLGTRATNSR